MTKRTIIIGDIHGCYDEMIALLEKCERKPEDEVISIGDLVDRGPKPWEVVAFFLQDQNACAIMGNHEDKHIRIRQGELRPSRSQIIAKAQLGEYYDQAVDYFETLPLWREREGYFLVHAGALSDVPISEQPRKVLLRAVMPWMKNTFDRRFPPWWSTYQSEVKVIYGHSVHEFPHAENGTVGIDTGCCHGMSLTAFVLPEGRFVQVDAKMDYWGMIPNQYRELWQKESQQKQNSTKRKPKKTKVKRKVGRLEIEGVRLDGNWILTQRTGAKPGSWIEEVLLALQEKSQKGEIQSLEDAKRILRLVVEKS